MARLALFYPQIVLNARMYIHETFIAVLARVSHGVAQLVLDR
jgi:hypothetical protein